MLLEIQDPEHQQLTFLNIFIKDTLKNGVSINSMMLKKTYLYLTTSSGHSTS